MLDNACKYCLEFVEISARQTDDHLYIMVEDDGPGIPLSKREVIFDRGQRIDTLRPGKALVWLSPAKSPNNMTENYRRREYARRRTHGGYFWPPAFCAKG